MRGFSAMTVQTVEAFAESLGLSAVPASDGSFNFIFARSGTLSLTPSADGRRILVSLARMPHLTHAANEIRLLERAGLDSTTSTFVHAGLAPDGSHVLAIEIDELRFDLPTLETSLKTLIAHHDELV